MENLIVALLVWISVSTGYGTATVVPLPYIEYRTFSELGVMKYGTLENTRGKPAVQAIHQQGTIFLRYDFDINNPEDRADLIHELTHYMQREEAVSLCPGKKEAEAYRVENTWRQEHGLTLIPEHRILLEEGMKCPPQRHINRTRFQ